jgi:hypothetical protein
MSSRAPYAGQRLPAATAPRVDEPRLVARYKTITNISQCARQAGISQKAVRAIPDRHGIPHGSPGPQTQGPPQAPWHEGANVPRR